VNTWVTTYVSCGHRSDNHERYQDLFALATAFLRPLPCVACPDPRWLNRWSDTDGRRGGHERPAGSHLPSGQDAPQWYLRRLSLLSRPRKAYYGLGVFIVNSWILQNPLFSGYQAIMAYLPSKKLAIAITSTLGEKSSPSTNYSTLMLQAIGRYLAPSQPNFVAGATCGSQTRSFQ
jgi:hypothetical protein